MSLDVKAVSCRSCGMLIRWPPKAGDAPQEPPVDAAPVAVRDIVTGELRTMWRLHYCDPDDIVAWEASAEERAKVRATQAAMHAVWEDLVAIQRALAFVNDCPKCKALPRTPCRNLTDVRYAEKRGFIRWTVLPHSERVPIEEVQRLLDEKHPGARVC